MPNKKPSLSQQVRSKILTNGPTITSIEDLTVILYTNWDDARREQAVWNDAASVARKLIAACKDDSGNRTILNVVDPYTNHRGYVHENFITEEQAELYLQDKIKLIDTTTKVIEHSITTIPSLIGVQPALPGLEGAVNRMTRLFERATRKSTKAAQKSTRR